MTAELVYEAAEQFDDAFFIFGALILLIELAEMLFKRTLRTKTVLEMIASASTQIPYLLVETLILACACGFSMCCTTRLCRSRSLLHGGASRW